MTTAPMTDPPHVVSSATMNVGFEIEVCHLSDGQRIIPTESMERFLDWLESGGMDLKNVTPEQPPMTPTEPNAAIERLPCPFCGENNNFAHADDKSTECGSCGAYGPTPAYGKGDWNTRATSTDQRSEAVEALREAQKFILERNWRANPSGRRALLATIDAALATTKDHPNADR